MGAADAAEGVVEHLWALVPGTLVVFLGFDAGGFFAGTSGLAAAGLSALVAVRLLTATRPALSVGAAVTLAAAALALYSGWTLLSQNWSHSEARALLAFDRAVLYTMVIGISSTLSRRARTMVIGVAVALVAICLAGLLSRVLPHAFPVSAGYLNQRLAYPVTYWNGLGMLAALGILVCVHVAGDATEWRVLRALACACVPALAATLLLTFSRGSIAALVVMLLAYIVMRHRLSLALTAVAAGVPSLIALLVTYNATALARPNPTTALAVTQGHHVAAAVAACVLAAGALQLLATLASGIRLPVALTRRRGIAAAAAVVLAAVIAAAALGAPSWVSRQYHHFLTSDTVPGGSTRSRLGSISNNGRLSLWHVALKGFSGSPVKGQGAGTYALRWQRDRPSTVVVQNAHSLYLENLDEVGVVGLALLVIALGSLVVGAARRPAVGALGFAAVLGWALHAGVDWDWQLPAVTAPALALGAVACAQAVREPRGAVVSQPLRARPRVALPRWQLVSRLGLAIGAVVLGIIPGYIAASQAYLDAGVSAFDRGDCASAIAKGRSASNAAPSRPEPHALVGYCELRLGAPAAARREMRQAIALDPANWEFHYALAVAAAWSGRDPSPQLAIARRLDPHEALVRIATDDFRGAPPRARRKLAREVPVTV